MRIAHVAAALALGAGASFLGTNADAEEYAHAGQLEMGGTFQIANVTDTREGAEDVTSTAIQISPVAGYWVTSWFEFLGSMDVRQLTIAKPPERDFS